MDFYPYRDRPLGVIVPVGMAYLLVITSLNVLTHWPHPAIRWPPPYSISYGLDILERSRVIFCANYHSVGEEAMGEFFFIPLELACQ